MTISPDNQISYNIDGTPDLVKDQRVVITAGGLHLICGISKVSRSGDFIDTSDATATAADIRKGKTLWVNGELITGTWEVDQ